MSSQVQGPMINGRYRLLDKVGAGGMAEVWRARDTALGRIVALKVLRTQYSGNPDFLARFRREAQAAANLTHPNIVNVFDIGQAGERHYIVMEYVDGRNLKELIRDQAPLSVERALDLATQVAAAVAHAHAAGIIHRDLKPQNILVDADDRVKVTDFGIARAMSAASFTDTGVVLGTAHYLSPEQAAGDPTTPATDVYALGVVLYEMLTGRTPFDAETTVGVALKHLQATPMPIQQLNPRVPAPVAAIVNRSMAKDPAQRYADAGALTAALRAVRDWGEQVTSAQPAIPRRPAQPPTPQVTESGFDRTGVLLGIVALVAVIGLIPLWRAVYSAYVSPTAASVRPAPAPTVGEVALIEVPNVVGLPQADAEDQLRGAGLQVNILGSRQDEEAPVSHVVQSDPAPGVRVDANTAVGLIISSGPPAVELPDVTGQPAGEAERSLREAGFEVEREASWGGDVPVDQVVSQDPPGGVRISRGSRVTIVVSAGPVIPVNANLGDQIELVEAELAQRTIRPGETLQLTLRWRARQSISQNHVVFVHVTQPDGRILTQRDSVPVDGGFPTTAWTSGQIVSDTYRLTIPGDAPAGTYEIRVGMYPFGQPSLDQRLPVVDAGQVRETLNSLIIGELEIGDLP
ncbi:MAG: protein kinase [Anaerolineae bacterium]